MKNTLFLKKLAILLLFNLSCSAQPETLFQDFKDALNAYAESYDEDDRIDAYRTYQDLIKAGITWRQNAQKLLNDYRENQITLAVLEGREQRNPMTIGKTISAPTSPLSGRFIAPKASAKERRIRLAQQIAEEKRIKQEQKNMEEDLIEFAGGIIQLLEDAFNATKATINDVAKKLGELTNHYAKVLARVPVQHWNKVIKSHTKAINQSLKAIKNKVELFGKADEIQAQHDIKAIQRELERLNEPLSPQYARLQDLITEFSTSGSARTQQKIRTLAMQLEGSGMNPRQTVIFEKAREMLEKEIKRSAKTKAEQQEGETTEVQSSEEKESKESKDEKERKESKTGKMTVQDQQRLQSAFDLWDNTSPQKQQQFSEAKAALAKVWAELKNTTRNTEQETLAGLVKDALS